MPNKDDYHVNPQFKIGFATPPTPSSTQQYPKLPNVNTPAVVAPATSRMMRKPQHSQQQHNYNSPSSNTEGKLSYDNTPHTDNTDNINNNGSNNNNVPQHTNSNEAQRQFHRKTLGEWDFLETIGAGSMGKVKLARHHQTNEICAIKIVNRATKAFLHKEQSLPPPQNEQELLQRQKKLEKEISRDKRTIREASLGQVLYHPHICRLYEMCTMSNHFYMLFEYVSGGQLLDYIIQHGSLREHHARKFARGIASALEYLHANNIVHRDLKIENIMISTSGEIKIIDFGLSNVYDLHKQLNTFCGSLYFAAPELLKAKPYTGPEVDVWSFGVVLYVLVCGKVPFDDEVSSVLHEKIKQGHVEYPNHLSIEVISLLSKMLVVDPAKRASLRQVIDHPWMNRGYDSKVKSYLPQRIPLTPEMLDQKVIKEMHRLEFVENVDDTRETLTKIITEPTYLELSKQYWENVSYIKRVNPNVTTNLTIEDPTRAYSPLLSIYYLVSEMLERKMAKLRRKQAQMVKLQQGQQQLQLQQIQNPLAESDLLNTKNNTAHSLQQPVLLQRNHNSAIQSTSPSNNNNIPQISNSPNPNLLMTNSQNENKLPLPPPQNNNNFNRVAVPVTTTAEKSANLPMNTSYDTTPGVPTPLLKSPLKRPVPKYGNLDANPHPINVSKHQPLKILVPPKLAIPEQAHTSPTSRKSSENHENFDAVVSPIPTGKDYYHMQQSATPADSNKSFGGILRRLSQRHDGHPQTSTLQTPKGQHSRYENDTNGPISQNLNNYGSNQMTLSNNINNITTNTTTTSTNNNNNNNLTVNSRGSKKTHARAVSEYTASVSRTQSFKVPVDHVHIITPPMRSASQKQPKKTKFPALPSNAEILLQEQKEKQLEQDMNNLKINGDQLQVPSEQRKLETPADDDVETLNDDNQPIAPLTIVKSRKYHPSARAKSVGHARRESLKFSRPPAPQALAMNNYPADVEDTGFLQYSDDSKSDSTRTTPSNIVSSNNSHNSTLLNATTSKENGTSLVPMLPELTDEEILAEAAKAPPGSMPSIDYPRSLFLKGFFSVQTTSSKPLPIVRYKIMYVLRKMNIDFKEVKGGFICVQRHFGNQYEKIEKNDNSAYSSNNIATPKPQLTGERIRDISRHSSIRRQQSLKQPFPGIPNTPNKFAHHERNVSLIASPISEQVGYNNISQELSSASIDDFHSPDDVLTTSKVQEMNMENNDNDAVDIKEKAPIRFEIHIVKVRIVGLAGVHFKKVSGNTWLYKELASNILKDLNL